VSCPASPFPSITTTYEPAVIVVRAVDPNYEKLVETKAEECERQFQAALALERRYKDAATVAARLRLGGEAQDAKFALLKKIDELTSLVPDHYTARKAAEAKVKAMGNGRAVVQVDTISPFLNVVDESTLSSWFYYGLARIR
jgi:hypothetical protein